MAFFLIPYVLKTLSCSSKMVYERSSAVVVGSI